MGIQPDLSLPAPCTMTLLQARPGLGDSKPRPEPRPQPRPRAAPRAVLWEGGGTRRPRPGLSGLGGLRAPSLRSVGESPLVAGPQTQVSRCGIPKPRPAQTAQLAPARWPASQSQASFLLRPLTLRPGARESRPDGPGFPACSR